MNRNDLKQRMVSALFWSFADIFMKYGIVFLVGIILARLLSPKEFGLFGMMMAFIGISQIFIGGGFSEGLIRKIDCGQKDYSTVFYFNLFAGLIFYSFLFLSAPLISAFYHEPQLCDLTRVLGIVLVINALGGIQGVILKKDINYKLQAKISVVAAVVSGALGIWLAYYGWGVWSLVWGVVVQGLVSTLLLWLWNTWRPIWLFDVDSFKELFGFGSKLVAASFLDTLYTNSFNLMIGRVYSAIELGYFTWANNFQSFPSVTLTAIIQRVTYPVLSSIQDDKIRLKNGFKKLVKNTMFLSFFLLIGIAAAAKPLVVALIGEKWLPAVPYLQLLCFSGMLYPLQAVNLNILYVKGRSDLFLRREVIEKLTGIPVVIGGVFWGIKVMLVLLIIHSIGACFLNAFWSGKMIGYPIKEQLVDIAPAFLGAIFMGACVFIVNGYLPYGSVGILVVQGAIGLVIAILISRMIKLDIYIELRELMVQRSQGALGNR